MSVVGQLVKGRKDRSHRQAERRDQPSSRQVIEQGIASLSLVCSHRRSAHARHGVLYLPQTEHLNRPSALTSSWRPTVVNAWCEERNTKDPHRALALLPPTVSFGLAGPLHDRTYHAYEKTRSGSLALAHKVEGHLIAEDALEQLTEEGVRSSLRFALQLLSRLRSGQDRRSIEIPRDHEANELFIWTLDDRPRCSCRWVRPRRLCYGDLLSLSADCKNASLYF